MQRMRTSPSVACVACTCVRIAIPREKILQRGGFLGALITPILSVLGNILMKHAKKMALVDPRVLEQLKDKESFEHEKQLDKKHSRSVEKKVTSASNLEIESILSDNTISDDQKMKMYSMALNRYLSAAKSLEMPWFAPVLRKLFKMDETALITPPAGVEEKEAEKMTEDPIIKNVPKAYQVRAKKLIGHLKDYTGIS